MRNPFRHASIKTHREEALAQAERDLLEAEFNAEHWESRRDMLRRRIERLERELDPQPKEIPHVDHLPLRPRTRAASAG